MATPFSNRPTGKAAPTSKIVQMVPTGDPEIAVTYHALCADGSIWQSNHLNKRWYLESPALTQLAPDLAAEVADLHDIVRRLNERLNRLEVAEAERGGRGAC
jgi:hypothetical protein